MSIPIIIPAKNPTSILIELIDALHVRSAVPIILVDDGSNQGSAEVFQQASDKPLVTLLRHPVNLGKGQALKTAFNHVLSTPMNSGYGVVTADADGQHKPDDIIKLTEQFLLNPNSLCLGVRNFHYNVPLRSKLGNLVTCKLFQLFSGTALRDTQTGLRAIPYFMLQPLMKLRTVGYDFELDMLLYAIKHGIAIDQLPITTIYESNNESSHFRPITDSVQIYKVLYHYWMNRK